MRSKSHQFFLGLRKVNISVNPNLTKQHFMRMSGEGEGEKKFPEGLYQNVSVSCLLPEAQLKV